MIILTLGLSDLIQAFRTSGHTVYSIVPPGLGPSEFDIEFDYSYPGAHTAEALLSAESQIKPDLVLLFDNSQPILFHGLENLSTPLAWYSIDTHIHESWHRHYAPLFKHVFCAQKNRVDSLKKYCRRVEWLPLYFGKDCKWNPHKNRMMPLSFVGTLNPERNQRRSDLFNKLAEIGIKVNLRQGDYLPVYSDSRIVINQSVNDDLNLRFFEAAGCGALLISEKLSHSNDSILIPGTDYLIYEKDDIADLKEKIDWALANPAEAEAIAERAYKKITLANHARHRCKRIIDTVTAIEEREIADNNDRMSHLAYAYQLNSELVLPEPFIADYRHRAYELALKIDKENPASPWSNLIIALRALENEKFAEVEKRLVRLRPPGQESDILDRYYPLRIISYALNGRIDAARQTLAEGLQFNPSNFELNELKQKLR
ncbi:MAG: glycosyltransferase [Fibrobacteres bacterium]|nr:glycosyltransferase [Fibrobacterota bacterium]